MVTSEMPVQHPSLLVYGPALAEDELLYSWMARAVHLNPMGAPREQMYRLFRNRNAIPCIDMPTRLQVLHQQLAAHAPCATSEAMIEVATLYPYHRPFLDQKRHLAVMHILLNQDGKGLKTLMGRVANRFGANPSLRYCPECVQRDIAQHGSPIWHVSHQLPGLSLCMTHGTHLINHLWTSQASQRQLLVLPPTNRPLSSPQSHADSQLQFARLSIDLLNAKLPPLGLLRLHQLYRHKLSEAGFCRAKGGILHKALSDAVRDHYGDFASFFHRERLLSSTAHPLYWLRALLEKPHQASHPICHILLIGFLYETMEKFQQATCAFRGLGTASTTSDTRQQESPVYVATNHPNAQLQEQVLRDTALSCRKAALRLGLSVTTVANQRRILGVPVPPRQCRLDAERRTAIAHDLTNGLSPPDVATRQAASLSSVYRIRMQIHDLLAPSRACKQDAMLQKFRNTWRQAVARYGTQGARQARAAEKSTYMWLYRHDRAWLLSTCQTIRLPRPHGPRLDWPARDQELCARIEAYAQQLRGQLVRPWLSWTKLARYLGETMVRANLSRLPLLAAKLEELSESRETYQKFRIDKAIERLSSDQHVLPIWRIRSLAGVRQWTLALQRYALKQIAVLPIYPKISSTNNPRSTNRP